MKTKYTCSIVFALAAMLTAPPANAASELTNAVLIAKPENVATEGASKKETIYVYNVTFQKRSAFMPFNDCKIIEWANKDQMLICFNTESVFVYNGIMYEIFINSSCISLFPSEKRIKMTNSKALEERLLKWREGDRGKSVLVDLGGILSPVAVKMSLAAPPPIFKFTRLVENKRLTLNFEVQGGYKGIVIFDEKLKVIKKELIHD